MSLEQAGEHENEVLQTESRHSDTQDVVNDLMQKLSAVEQDAFSSRCRYCEVLLTIDDML